VATRGSALAIFFLWIVACSVIVGIAWYLALISPGFGWNGWLTYTSPYWRVMEFGVGVLVAKLVDAPKPHWPGSSAHILGLAGAALLPLPWLAQAYLPLGGITTVVGFAPGIGLIIFYLATYETILSRLLGIRRSLSFGDASYSIYFLHPWLIPMFNTTEPSKYLFLYKQCAIWMLSIVLSIGLYATFERPMRNYIRARFAASKPRSN
jgi:peptidoglycan/LPS O-acetylase OafA/YrhL